MNKQEYAISELADEAEVTLRTIRYYISEGLLPPPAGTSRAAVYQPEHLDRLNLIKILKDEFLPLQEIKTLLDGLSHQQVQELLVEKQKSEEPPPLTEVSAKEYLHTLLQTPDQSQVMMRHRVEAIQQSGASVSDKKRQSEAKPALRRRIVAREVTQPYHIEDKLTEIETEVEEVAEEERGEINISTPTGNTWQRIPLSANVELHVKGERANSPFWQKIEQLIQVARQILSNVF